MNRQQKRRFQREKKKIDKTMSDLWMKQEHSGDAFNIVDLNHYTFLERKKARIIKEMHASRD